MKKKLFAAAAALLASIFFLFACSSETPDAGALFREAYSLAGSMENGTLYYESQLTFTIQELEDSPTYSFSQRNDTTYRKDPFGLYTLAVSNAAGAPSTLESYVLEENGSFVQYSQSGDGWFKTPLEELDTDPQKQLDMLQLLSHVKGQSYLREEEWEGIAAHKLELSFDGECLRSLLETLIVSSGMDSSAGELTDVLIESLNSLENGTGLHGYCWISKEDGRLLHLELDASQRMQQVFEAIDGAEDAVKISQCTLAAGFSDIGGTKFPSLPEEAQNASSVEAVG